MIITQKSVFARPANETLRGDIKRVRRNHSLLRPHCCNAYVRTVCKVNKISPALLLSEAQTKGFNVRKGRSDPPQAYIFGTNLRNGWIRNGREMRIDAIGLGSGLAPIDLASSWNLWLILLGSASIGLWADRTKFGTALSGPVCTMLITAVLSNVGVLPPPGPNLAEIQGTVVKLATPLLLYSSDLRRIFRQTGQLLQSFAWGTVASVVGSIVAFGILSDTMGGVGGLASSMTGSIEDGWKVAAALLAKNIGGGINYIAVATTLDVSPKVIAAGITVDNLYALVYFPLVGWLGNMRDPKSARNDRPSPDNQLAILAEDDPGHYPQNDRSTGEPSPARNKEVTVSDLCWALTLGVGLVVLSQSISSTASIPISTALAVVGATAFPQHVGRLAPAGDLLGKLFLFIFFATAGASGGKLSDAFAFTPIFMYLGLLYLVHLGIMLTVWKVRDNDLAEILVASNANIGGPATASALAVGKGWNHLISPGLLVGSLGNAAATFIGLSIGTLVLQRL
mmetsp:Transcript_26001/g.49392  ORF Transcript_26001/g.49392 Transcript_26001/m.49392 type:complete len:510 (+) Transcript_26001:403-1932(+)|eukprot:CAMPEP_0114231730 /NCGR_PEP_ID=MMETSP0058-20121206/4212_1 /TAXON_ID=36894 /ORGANISM="Pyramimonas parkeae, CCMP726" /LENGTH=509 /DNA_ID=CAMNT_0001343123 /DNA_START=254 /DNA_END=1783 /DNA_ORIENTATION=-